MSQYEHIYHDIELTVTLVRQTYIHTLHCKFKFKLDVYHKQKLLLFIMHFDTALQLRQVAGITYKPS